MLKVSVITPTYNGADYIGEAIRSVLTQTYSNLEMIVVDDVSPDNTREIVNKIHDPRLIYIMHDINRGADAARHTALQASSGQIIAFLDQDDYFHPEKLQAHVNYLTNHPDIGFTYNGRFELTFSQNTIRDIWRPPHEISLADLVSWFPLSPSDVVLRREWALEMDLLSGTRGAEILHFSHLFMAGCQFAHVDRVLNYRRHHSGRILRNLAAACAAELNNQILVFSDKRCPAEVLALRNVAHANIYMYWAYMAYAQNDITLGQQYLREAVHAKPAILVGQPAELVNNLLINSIADENLNHEQLLQTIFSQLPPEIASISEQCQWAVAQGYLLKGVRAVIWDRTDEGRIYFDQAASLNARFDESTLSTVASQLLDYEAVFGIDAAQTKLSDLAANIANPILKKDIIQLINHFSINRAFLQYQAGENAEVSRAIFRAIINNPGLLANRGVVSTLFRSAMGISPKSMAV